MDGLADVLAAWGLGDVPLDRIQREHLVMAHARDRGIPVRRALPTRDGTTILEHHGRPYSVFQLARGEQVPRRELSGAHAAAMGECLARVHVALMDCPPPPVARTQPAPTMAGTLRRIDEILERIRRLPAPGPQEEWAAELLRARARWLQAEGARPMPVPAAQTQQIHGDFQDTNLFFEGGAVSSVIDWDKTERGWRAVEVVRTAHLAFQLDAELVARFVRAYRERLDLPTQDLEEAVAHYGTRLAHDLWVFHAIYVRGDDRVRRFLGPPEGPSQAFTDRWRTMRLPAPHA